MSDSYHRTALVRDVVSDGFSGSTGIATVLVALAVVTTAFAGGASAATSGNASVVAFGCHGGGDPAVEIGPHPLAYGIANGPSFDSTQEMEVESFDAAFSGDTEVTVTVEFNREMSSGEVRLFDGDGNHLGDGRLIETTTGEFVYDSHFQVAGEPGDTYRAVLLEAEDDCGEEVRNPEQYEDSVSVATPEPTTTPEPTQTPAPTPDPTPVPTATPMPTDTPVPTDDATDPDGEPDDDGGPTTTVDETTDSGGDAPTTEDPADNPEDSGGLGSGALIVLVVIAGAAAAAVIYRMRR